MNEDIKTVSLPQLETISLPKSPTSTNSSTASSPTGSLSKRINTLQLLIVNSQPQFPIPNSRVACKKTIITEIGIDFHP